MKKNLLLLLGAVLFMSSNPSFGQNQIEKFEINSQEVKGETYSIEIVLPDGYDSTKKYPIIYFTDWRVSSQLTLSLYSLLNSSKYTKIEPVIIVGIKNKKSISVDDWLFNRRRDFTPTNVLESDSLRGVPAGTSGGAKHFLSFIKNELIPTVEQKYASDIGKRGYFGWSLGGLFGIYTLLNDPELFKKYLIVSPSLWWDDYLLSKELEEMKAENLASIKSIFIAVEEEGSQLQGYSQIKEQILKKKQENMDLETVIILDEDHLTALPSSIIKGLKFLYGK